MKKEETWPDDRARNRSFFLLHRCALMFAERGGNVIHMNPETQLLGIPVRLGEPPEFPDPRNARSPLFPGLVAIGGGLSPEILLAAYRKGIFPWTSEPVTWWSPDPRAILELNAFHVSSSLAKLRRRCAWRESNGSGTARFQLSRNAAFQEVIAACARQRNNDTWISADFIEAYTRLHDAGHAHSVECWQGNELAGGIYGVAIGGLFAGESMFHRTDNASKLALCGLTEHLRERGFVLFDLQMLTPVTRHFGGIEIPRDDYLRRLESAVAIPARF